MKSHSVGLGFVLASLLLASSGPDAQVGTRAKLLVTDGQGGFAGPLEPADRFGAAATALGDLDGDGVGDVAIGASGDDDGGVDSGAVWILFLRGDGSAMGAQKISNSSGGLGGVLAPGDGFGAALAFLGDFDGDGNAELAVGADGDRTSGAYRGAVWILDLDAGGLVLAAQRITDGVNGFVGPLSNYDRFGGALAALGDLDGDGIGDLAVGAGYHDDGGLDNGAAWILFLAADTTVRQEQKISNGAGGLGGTLASGDHFGSALANVGDLDGDGHVDLVAGAPGDDGDGIDRGALWVLHLAADGTLVGDTQLVGAVGTWDVDLADRDRFGTGVTALGDLDGDGRPELAVGAPGNDAGGTDRGAVWVLFLDETDAVRWEAKIDGAEGGLDFQFEDGDAGGTSVAAAGDLDGDGIGELVVGVPHGDGPVVDDSGAAFVLSVGPYATLHDEAKLNGVSGGLVGPLANGDRFGSGLARLRDHDGNGFGDLAVGAPGDDEGGADRGALWIVSVAGDGTAAAELRIADGIGGFSGSLADGDLFGHSLSVIGDLDGDGNDDLAVGAPGGDGGGPDRGAVWILFPNGDGTVRDELRIDDTTGGFADPLDDGAGFGGALAGLGDLDGDGIGDLVVSAPLQNEGGAGRGAVWILFLRANGTVRAEQRISTGAGGFGGTLADHAGFGTGLAALGDVDGDGVEDLAVGAPGDGDGGEGCGAVWILFLRPGGTVAGEYKVSNLAGRFRGWLRPQDGFGGSLTSARGLYGRDEPRLLVGAVGTDEDGTTTGAVWMLDLGADGLVGRQQKVSPAWGEFGGVLGDGDRFGFAHAVLDDLDRDSVAELAIGAPFDHEAGPDQGAVWLLFPTPGDNARAVFRTDGEGRNALGYEADVPLLGQEWNATVDNALTGSFIAVVVGFTNAAEIYVSKWEQYVLVDPTSPPGELLGLAFEYGAGLRTFTLTIPDDIALAGFSMSTQGAGVGGSDLVTLHNAYDLVLGSL